MGVNKVVCPWVCREGFTPEPKRELVRNLLYFFNVKSMLRIYTRHLKNYLMQT